MQIGRIENKAPLAVEGTLLRSCVSRERHTAVLVAAMSAREGQRSALDEPAAAHAIARCLDVLAGSVEASGGRVVRKRDAELMALFATADAAAAAAAQLHREAAKLSPESERELRTAFHAGPLRQRGHGVFGDALNRAAELASRAAPGRIMTSSETAAGLHGDFRRAMRAVAISARSGVSASGELDWRALPPSAFPSSAERKTPGLRITYRYNTLLRRREGDVLTIGRDPDCDVCIDMRLASRRHCTLERRRDHFVVRDHSTNGTFVALDGERELRIRSEELALHGRGWLSLGASRLLAEELVEFRCE
jgi:class 3 adenylate cyclase